MIYHAAALINWAVSHVHILECLLTGAGPAPAKEGYLMGGDATPGLGPPEEELVLGRVSSDLALCIPTDVELPLLAPLTTGDARPNCPVWYGFGAVGLTVCKCSDTKDPSVVSGSKLGVDSTLGKAGLRLAMLLLLQMVVSETARVRGLGGLALSGEKAV